MSTAKIITVFGATGAQGNSVMKSLLANTKQQFHVRGTTRNTESKSAKALTALGGEMIELKSWSHEALVDVLKGSWGLFLNTHSQMAVSPDLPPSSSIPCMIATNTRIQSGDTTEPEIGKIIVDAASEAGVHTIVYSGLPSVSEATKGVLQNPDFDGLSTS